MVNIWSNIRHQRKLNSVMVVKAKVVPGAARMVLAAGLETAVVILAASPDGIRPGDFL
jgi:hypothetical protein